MGLVLGLKDFKQMGVFLGVGSSLEAEALKDYTVCPPQFIEPCRSDRWTTVDMALYLTHYSNSAHILDTFRSVEEEFVFQPI